MNKASPKNNKVEPSPVCNCMCRFNPKAVTKSLLHTSHLNLYRCSLWVSMCSLTLVTDFWQMSHVHSPWRCLVWRPYFLLPFRCWPSFIVASFRRIFNFANSFNFIYFFLYRIGKGEDLKKNPSIIKI